MNLNLLNFEVLHMFTILKQALVCMSPILWKRYLISVCLPSCLIKILTAYVVSKFWGTVSRISLYVDNFGAWKMHIWVLESHSKVLEFCALRLLWTLHVKTVDDAPVLYLHRMNDTVILMVLWNCSDQCQRWKAFIGCTMFRVWIGGASVRRMWH